MGAFADARDDANEIRDNPALVAKLRAELCTLIEEKHTSDTFGFDLTSATINGQTYGGEVTITKNQRLKDLRLLFKHLDANASISSRTTPYFGDVKEIAQ